MTSRALSPLVIGGSALLLVLGMVVGFRLLTASADTSVTGPTCEDQTIAAGEDLTSNLVTVDVYNASRRAGLANRVSINLQRRGFLAGEVRNSQSAVEPEGDAVILTDDPDDPRVRLVAGHFKKVDYAEPDVALAGSGVPVLVGDDFGKLVKKAPRSHEAEREVTVCVPLPPVL